MLERYTEKARRVIFFARYEASQFGAHAIETEHILLGLLREDKGLALSLGLRFSVEEIRSEIEAATMAAEKTSTSVDLPLSEESKRVLKHAAEEADALGHPHVGTEHLLAGLLRESGTFGARLLEKRGFTLDAVRQLLKAGPAAGAAGISSGSMLGGKVATHIVRRWIEIVSETEGTLLGKIPAIHVPAVGAELAFQNKRFQVRRVVHHLTNGEALDMLWPEKIVVHVVQL